MRRFLPLLLSLSLFVFLWGIGLGQAARPAAQLSPMLPAQNILPVAHFGGEPTAVFAEHPYAYVAFGPTLLLLDVSEPASPVTVGKVLLPDIIQDIEVSEGYAYLALGASGWSVVDVREPTRPGWIATYSTVGMARALAVQAGHVYVAAESALQIFDATAPGDAAEVGRYEGQYITMVFVQGTHVYVDEWEWVNEYSGMDHLAILDISDPSQAVKVGFYRAEEVFQNVQIVGTYAYTIERYSFDRDLRMKRVDLSDPANPTVEEEVWWGQSFMAMDKIALASSGNSLYLAYRYLYKYSHSPSSALMVLDLDRPLPQSVYGTDVPANEKIAVSGGYLYSASQHDGFHIVDVDSPGPSFAVATLDNGLSGQLLEVADDRMLLVDQETSGGGGSDEPYVVTDTLHILDISNVKFPVERGRLDFSRLIIDMWLVGPHHAYFKSWLYETAETRIHIVDFSDPDNPQEVASYRPPGYITDLKIAEPYAYLAWSAADGTMLGGLRILDISDPARPVEIGAYDLREWVRGVDAEAGVAYLISTYNAYNDTRLRRLDVSDPTKPQETHTFPIWTVNDRLLLAETRAYLSREHILYTLDLSDLTQQPPSRGGHYAASRISDITLDGDLLYLTEVHAGLRVLDTGNIDHLASVGFYGIPGSTSRVAVSGPYAFVTASTGLYVLEYARHRLYVPLTSIAGD